MLVGDCEGVTYAALPGAGDQPREGAAFAQHLPRAGKEHQWGEALCNVIHEGRTSLTLLGSSHITFTGKTWLVPTQAFDLGAFYFKRFLSKQGPTPFVSVFPSQEVVG